MRSRRLLGQRLKQVSEGRLRRPARFVHTALVATQLATLARLDRLRRELPTSAEQDALSARVTMIIKTFERPAIVQRLVSSARTVFPGRIVVADDSREPLTSLGDGVEILALPFNVGLSAGRNAALDVVETEFVFLTDDDSVFTAATDIVAMMEYLDDYPEVDIIAPDLVYLPWWYKFRTDHIGLLPGAEPPLRQVGEEIGGATVVNKVQNVFLARTEALKRVRWEDRLRLIEHDDFFSRASGKLVSVQADGVRAYHARTPFDAFYMRFRNDVAESNAVVHELWPATKKSRRQEEP